MGLLYSVGLCGRNLLVTLPGAHVSIGYRFRVRPVSHQEFAWIASISTAAWLISLLPLFPVKLDIDERGITQTKIGREHFHSWSDLVDIKVSDTGGFRGRGGAIRFIRRGETGPRKPVDLSPGMFHCDKAELAALIQKGIARWGAQGGAETSSISRHS